MSKIVSRTGAGCSSLTGGRIGTSAKRPTAKPSRGSSTCCGGNWPNGGLTGELFRPVFDLQAGDLPEIAKVAGEKGGIMRQHDGSDAKIQRGHTARLAPNLFVLGKSAVVELHHGHRAVLFDGGVKPAICGD